MCVHLKRWPIDRARRRRPGLRRKPLALVGTAGAKRVVAAACEAARASGVRPGMTLAEARALAPGLIHAPYDPARDAHALGALGRWLMRFSPCVAPQPPDALFLDVGGCERLFHGLDNLLRRVGDSLAGVGVAAGLAVAPTAGAAWALAAMGGRDEQIVTEGEVHPALAPLPPEALRIDRATAATLRQLGIDSIGLLMALPRQALPARFGPDLLRRLDQALGRLAEPLVPLAPRTPVGAKIDFDGPVESLEVIWLAFRKLLGEVIADLARRGCGARRVRVVFAQDHAPPVERAILLSRPSRDPANLFNLLRCATEQVRGEVGFTGIQLDVPVFEPLAEEQILLVGQEEQDADARLARLIEHLRVRLGEGGVERPMLVESHLPERACRYVAVETPAAPPRRPAAPPVADAVAGAGGREGAPLPLRLLPTPAEVRVMVAPSDDREGRPVSFTCRGVVHPVASALGPERIGGVWWEGHNRTRDYFDVADKAGRRFWIFRVTQTGKWYLHGVFA